MRAQFHLAVLCGLLACQPVGSTPSAAGTWASRVSLPGISCNHCFAVKGLQLEEDDAGTITGWAASYVVNPTDIASGIVQVTGRRTGDSVVLTFADYCPDANTRDWRGGFRGRLDSTATELDGTFWQSGSVPTMSYEEVLKRGPLDTVLAKEVDGFRPVQCK